MSVVGVCPLQWHRIWDILVVKKESLVAENQIELDVQ